MAPQNLDDASESKTILDIVMMLQHDESIRETQSELLAGCKAGQGEPCKQHGRRFEELVDSTDAVQTPAEQREADKSGSVGIPVGLRIKKPEPSLSLPAAATNSEKAKPTNTSTSVGIPAGDEVDDVVLPLEPSPLLRGQQTATTRPGAIAMAGLGGDGAHTPLARGQLTSQESLGFSSTCSLAQTEEPEAHRLAVASPVQDEETVVATEHTLTPQGRKQPDKAHASRHALLLGSIFFVFLVVVPVVFICTKKQNKNSPANHPSETLTSNLPTQAPTSFLASLLSLFPDSTVHAIMEDSNSPQSMAFQWLLEDDMNLPTYSDERIIQKFSLATLYYATNGDGWTQRSSWLNHSVHECQWFQQPSPALKHIWEVYLPGYLKDFSNEQSGLSCDRDSTFLNLWLDQNNLKGSFPLELYLLTSLRTMTVTLNLLEGTIPTELGLLTNLEALVFTYLTSPGTIPSEIGLLTKLRALALDDNMLTGTVPSELLQLTNLGSLFLFQNPHLGGTLPSEIGTFSNLYWVSWHNTGLTGTIPSELGLLHESMEWLIMFDNQLTGTLPSTLGQLSNIKLFSVYENALTGPMPSEFGLMQSAALLSFRSNQFTGSVPSELGLLNLTATLNLRNNELSGTIPTELGLLSKLQELELRNNQLTGTIPSELGQITKMGYLSFANNSLEGMIPLELWTLEETLYALSLEGNPMLKGRIPEGICNMNKSCVPLPIDPCDSYQGISFECSTFLCGCDCPCEGL